MPNVSGASAVNTRAHTKNYSARTRLRVHWGPGIPRALGIAEGGLSGKARAWSRRESAIIFSSSFQGASSTSEPQMRDCASGFSRFRVRCGCLSSGSASRGPGDVFQNRCCLTFQSVPSIPMRHSDVKHRRDVRRSWARRRARREMGLCSTLRTAAIDWFCSKLAGELGFEPRQTESESVVLPLHHSPPK